MRILVICSSIYDDILFKNNRNITGLSVMIRDIFDKVADTNEVYIWHTGQKGKTIDKHQLHILPFSKLQLLLNAPIIQSLLLIFRHLLTIKKNNVVKDTLSEFLFECYLDKLLNEINPDVVNFHDLNSINVKLIMHCQRKGCKILVTDHLYIGSNPPYKGYGELIENEKKIFNLNNISISFICTGMKNRMLADFPNFKKENVYVISDGSSFIEHEITFCSSLNQKKIFLCIGNYCERKNQKQLISAIRQMPDEIKNQIKILFFGKDSNNEIYDEIKSVNGDCLEYMGVVEPNELKKYYSMAYATISVSLNEGFGLTIIEGFSYGIPAILFKDIDSFSDIYSPACCVAIEGHDDSDIVYAIKTALLTKWCPVEIKKEAQKYNMETVAKKYNDLFFKISKNG